MATQLVDINANPVFTDINAAGVPAALSATVTVNLRGQASATVQVTGIGSLTLTFEGTTDGTNFDPIFGTPVAGGAAVSSTTANGHWVNFNVAGLTAFRARVSAYTSGSATVTVVASQGSPQSNYTAAGINKVDLASVNGTALGAPTNFGTTPGAVTVVSVNSSVFVGTVVAVAASAGVQKVGISGATGATMDGVITAATAPVNGLAVLVENVTTAPSLTTGQSVMAQADYQGSLFVKPYRRGQTKGQATTISATGATTIVTAQAAGIFADIAEIIITTAGLAAQTITISDGTLSWIIDYPNAAVAPGTPFTITFDPPLAATTAATAWTANQSLATACHYLVNFVLQKAS